MTAVASRIFCERCGEETLHSSAGCCRHPTPRATVALERCPRKAPTRGTSGRHASKELTARERYVATYAVNGMPVSDIAAMLGLSRTNISSVLCRARQRAGVSTTAELANYLRRSGT